MKQEKKPKKPCYIRLKLDLTRTIFYDTLGLRAEEQHTRQSYSLEGLAVDTIPLEDKRYMSVTNISSVAL